MPFYFEKPLGTKDLLPEEKKNIDNISRRVRDLLEKWGYQEIETPIIEYKETVGNFSCIPEERLLKFLDGEGRFVILRPDLTTPIARFAASVYRSMALPLRLMYQGSVYRSVGNKGVEERRQLGYELIGAAEIDTDAEVIVLAAKSIALCFNGDFKIFVGNVGFLKTMFSLLGLNEKVEDDLFTALLNYDYVEFRSYVNSLEIEADKKEKLNMILQMKGNLNALGAARDWFASPEWQYHFIEFGELWSILENYGVSERVSFDLSRVGKENYYTGFIYTAYCEGHPEPIASGGRYDSLLANFDRAAPATGFALDLNALLDVQEDGLRPMTQVLLTYGRGKRTEAAERAEELRSEGKSVSLVLKESAGAGLEDRFNEIIEL